MKISYVTFVRIHVFRSIQVHFFLPRSGKLWVSSYCIYWSPLKYAIEAGLKTLLKFQKRHPNSSLQLQRGPVEFFPPFSTAVQPTLQHRAVDGDRESQHILKNRGVFQNFAVDSMIYIYIYIRFIISINKDSKLCIILLAPQATLVGHHLCLYLGSSSNVLHCLQQWPMNHWKPR